MPFLLLSLYAVVYAVIFRVSVPGLTTLQYTLLIFSGLVPFLMTSEALSAGTSSLLGNKSALNSSVFPIDLFAPKAVLMSQATALVGFPAIVVGMLYGGKLSWNALLLPAVWLLHIMALMGMNWILSTITLVFRDLQHLVGLVLILLMVASPIAYTPEMVPHQLKFLIFVNPLAYYIIAYQHILVLGRTPGLFVLLCLLLMSIGIFFVGGWFFNRVIATVVDYV